MFRGVIPPKQIGYMMNNDVEFAQELDVKIDELIDQKITEPLKYKVIFNDFFLKIGYSNRLEVEIYAF